MPALSSKIKAMIAMPAAGLTHSGSVLSIDDDAIGIANLDEGVTRYGVTFSPPSFANQIYGEYPGSFPIFNTPDEALAAVEAIDGALNTFTANSVGPLSGTGFSIYNIGYDSLAGGPFDLNFVSVARGFQEAPTWTNGGLNQWLYDLDEKTYALL